MSGLPPSRGLKADSAGRRRPRPELHGHEAEERRDKTRPGSCTPCRQTIEGARSCCTPGPPTCPSNAHERALGTLASSGPHHEPQPGGWAGERAAGTGAFVGLPHKLTPCAGHCKDITALLPARRGLQPGPPLLPLARKAAGVRTGWWVSHDSPHARRPRSDKSLQPLSLSFLPCKMGPCGAASQRTHGADRQISSCMPCATRPMQHAYAKQ